MVKKFNNSTFVKKMMSIEEIYKIFLECNQTVCTDTRNIIKDSLFIGIKGEKHDGNLFVEEALTKGCKFAISDNYNGTNASVIKVNNSITVLQELAKYHRKELNTPIIAITGTNGKTTTKELIASVLKQKYQIIYTQGNYNNHIGVPLTLLNLRHSSQLAVVEMGANHPGEIDFLCQIAEPNFGLITNVGKAHLEGFGSFEGVVNTKTELYRYLNKNNGLIFVNKENNILFERAKQYQYISYGKSKDCFVYATSIEANPTLEITWTYPKAKTILSVKTNLIGLYNWENVLAAITIGKYFNITDNIISKAIEEYIPSNHRSQWITLPNYNILMDAYNANPTSMNAALNNFFNLNYPNKMVILGDMLELGEYSIKEHQAILDILNKQPDLEVILVGKTFGQLNNNPNYRTYLTVDALIDDFKNNLPLNKTILIKGSHGIHLEKLLPLFYDNK